MKKLLCLAICVLGSTLAFGQGVRILPSLTVTTPGGGVVPFPTFRICTEVASGTTCIPLTNLFLDRGMQLPTANPITGDQFGNIPVFFVAPGIYHVQINGTGISQIDLPFVSVADMTLPVWQVAAPATCSSTVNLDPTLATIFPITLTGNCTASLINVTAGVNLFPGKRITFKITQDGVGGRSFTCPAAFVNCPSVTNIGANNSITSDFWFDGTNWNPMAATSLAAIGPGVAPPGVYDFSQATLKSAAYITTTRGDRQVILQNPDFEGSSVIPPPGWVVNAAGATLSYETTSPAPNKLQSLKISTTVSGGGIVAVNKYSAVVGETYSINVALKADGSSSAIAFLWAIDKNGTGIANLGVATNNTTSWQMIAVNGTVPANTAALQLFVENVGTQPSSIWVDQISVQKTNFPGSLSLTNPSGTSTTISLTDPISARLWQLRVGGAATGAFDVFDSSDNFTAIWAGSSEVRIGTKTNIGANQSRLYVFGGANGANVDIQADGTATDQAVVELEGSDYATHANSVRMEFQGINALGTTAGLSNVNLANLECGGTCANLMIDTRNTAPIVFATNLVERMRLLNGYQLNLGVAGTGSGILGFNGATSGTATFTAPAVAGTVTNAVVSSNSLQAPVFNGTTGFQVNGTALAAANLSNGVTGSGAVVLATTPSIASPTITGTAAGTATLPQGMVTPGSNGQCLITSGAATVWGSCSGQTTVLSSGVSTVSLNGNTTAWQAPVTFNVPSANINHVGALLRVTVDGASISVNTTQTVQLGISFVGPAGACSIVVNSVPTTTAGTAWHAQAQIGITSTGVAGFDTQSGMASTDISADSASSSVPTFQIRHANNTGCGVNTTISTNQIQLGCSYTTASTTNTCTITNFLIEAMN